MNLSLKEGQVFSDRFTLLYCMSSNEQAEIWLTIDSQRNERVSIKFFKQPLNDSVTGRIEEAVTAQRDLYHPNIARTYEIGSHQGISYLVSQAPDKKIPDNLEFLDVSAGLSSALDTIKKLMEALEYSHTLGLADGHLRPEKILINDQNEPVITDFGLPVPLPQTSEDWNYLSPQIRANHAPDKSDDIYSLGQLLYRLISKRFWNQDHPVFESDSITGDDLVTLVTKMLSLEPYERPDSIPVVKEWLDRSLNPKALEDIIEPIYSRTTNRITPPELKRGRELSSRESLNDKKTIKASSAMLAISLLVIFSIAFFYFVSPVQIDLKKSERSSTTNTESQNSANKASLGGEEKEPTDKIMAPYELAQLEHAREEAGKIADNIIRYQLKLEDKGVQVWAARGYQQTMLLAQEADELYRDGDYLTALKKYDMSMDLLQQIDNSIQNVLSSYQIKGDNALTKGDHQSALEAFTIITAITPEDTLARSKLVRAENLPEVASLTNQAEAYEYQNNLSDALKIYQKALKLDPLWSPAIDGADRVSRKITSNHFSDAMSEGFNSLSKRQYELAREAFQKAQSLIPSTTEPQDGLMQVEVAEQSERIMQLKTRASLNEKEEKWKIAMEAYKELLILDSTLSFAQTGKERSGLRLNIDQDLQKYINYPEVMKNDEELSAAKKSVYSASKLKVNSPRLNSQLSQLSMLISQARIPVSVKLISDNKTNVTVYKIDQMGRFTEKDLQLIPGSYTVVGKRSGYRDVQKKVVLLSGRESRAVFIACEEKI